MATLVLSTVGAAVGAQIGGTVLGVSAAAIGQSVGAIAGATIDHALLAPKAARREGPRLDRLHFQSSGEGDPLPRVWGRMRVGGRVIWASNFTETSSTRRVGGDKLGGGAKVRDYAYAISFAVALSEGPIDRIGRVWADGDEINLADYAYRLYTGDETQAPDPLIAAIEGQENAPAYRGVAYLVFEDMPLAAFGNRTPLISVEVLRAPPAAAVGEPSLEDLIKGVALSPGSGEFTLATTSVRRQRKEGVVLSENMHSVSGDTDLVRSLDQLQDALPNVETVSLVVGWFGDDLRCGHCRIRPGVERYDRVTAPLTWSAGGVGRGDAHLVSADDKDRPNFGGTPADVSVVEAIQELKARGLRVFLYPFLFMDVPEENSRTDPWTGAGSQPAFPWRGRVTLDAAPGQPGSTDKTSAAADEVAAFFGTAAAGDFSIVDAKVSYAGPSEFRYRRFILHYAALAAAAGGVDAFAIGSEMRSLTQIRSGADTYPAVAALQDLATEARAILGASTKLTYAADWSEYFGHQPGDGSGDVYFHLDPLWAEANIDAIGIDAYFPLSDWRDDSGVHNEGVASIYDTSYLRGNVEGGEYYDWYYGSDADRAARVRRSIEDGAYGEPWVFRPKDLRNWWSNAHHNRPGGVRASASTPWVPQSKPIWLTEIGCPAVDRGANQPNVFYTPKSSESALPYFSKGVRDDVMQRRYLSAALGYWSGANNPTSSVYDGPMLDPANTHVWTWDARPWPDFPNRAAIWSDGDAHGIGHWLTGRLGSASVRDVIAALCMEAGLTSEEIDVELLFGVVEGVKAEGPMAARSLIEPLLFAYDIDVVESDGVLCFRPRSTAASHAVTTAEMVVDDQSDEVASPLERTRIEASALPKSIRVSFTEAAGDYQVATVEAARMSDADATGRGAHAANGELPMALYAGRAQAIADRALAQAWAARDRASFLLPPSARALEPSDVVDIETPIGRTPYRIRRIVDGLAREVEAERIDPNHAVARVVADAFPTAPRTPVYAPPVAIALDLPLLSGDEAAHAPFFAAFLDPWPGPMTLWRGAGEGDAVPDARLLRPAVIGRTLTALPAGSPHRWTRGVSVDVELSGGALQSRSELSVLNGANALALESPNGQWEVLQFRDAELIGEDVYRLSCLLRGQAGTEPFIGEPTLSGARIVLLDEGIAQSGLPSADLGLTRRYWIGPENRAISTDTHAVLTHASTGVGYRPYAPAHLRSWRGDDGALEVSWIRRARLGGDAWDIGEPPLGEDREAYRVRILSGAEVVLNQQAASPSHRILAADLPAAPFAVHVAQLSERFGPGPEAALSVPSF